jgi:outer membrane protein OmpA-like peptidoglycan-associated protein
MKRISRLTFALSLAVLGALSLALAEPGEKGSWELGVFGGYCSLDEYGSVHPDDDSVWGGRVGYFLNTRWSLEASYQDLSTEVEPGLGDFEISSPRFNALYNFRPGSSFRPFVTGGVGFENTEFGAFDETDEGFNAGAGARWSLGRRFGLRVDARYVNTFVSQGVDWQRNIEATGGLLLSLGGGAPGDEDGDGVADRKDDCPGTARGATVDAKGCPKDSDGDGVFDGIDKCPDTPEGCPVDTNGCPKDSDGDGVIDCRDKCADTARGCTVDESGCAPDADGDGVCDGADRCPNTPKGCTVDEKGCPKDADGDGVCDGVDRCANTPKSCTVDATGCPKDEDGDRVCDGVDRCPGTPAGRKVDERGCELAFDERGKLRLEGVNFAYDSDRLTEESKGILDGVAASLKEWAEVRVEIGGHTDSRGSDGYNQKLSQARAESVRAYLASKGVAADRLTAKGYGESQPESDNDTDAGRARNRRVELKRLN